MTDSADVIVREQVFLSLTPFFLEAAGGDAEQARAAAEKTVAGYNPGSTEALLLVAQVVVYALASLDSARRSASHPDLPVSTHLRLRGNAGAMQRAAAQCQKALDRCRRTQPVPPDQAAPPQTPTITEADVQAAVQRAAAIIQEARAAAQPQKTMTYWEARRETERQKRLAKRAARTLAGRTGEEKAVA